MFQLIYRSTHRAGRIDSPLKLLREILAVSVPRNAADGITGFLLYDGAAFLQILEGEESLVRATCARIDADVRHRDLEVIAARDVAERDFPDWSMGGRLREGRDAETYRRHGVAELDFAAYPAEKIVALARDLAAR